MVLGMLLAGLRRCEVLGLRFCDAQVAGRRLVVMEGKSGHHRIVPPADWFFDELGTRIYLHLASDWLATEYRRAAAPPR